MSSKLSGSVIALAAISPFCCETSDDTILDIYDLADKIRKKLENEVEELYSFEREHNYNSNNYLKLLQHIKDNQIFYQTYFKLGYNNQHKNYIYDINQARNYSN